MKGQNEKQKVIPDKHFTDILDHSLQADKQLTFDVGSEKFTSQEQ